VQVTPLFFSEILSAVVGMQPLPRNKRRRFPRESTGPPTRGRDLTDLGGRDLAELAVQPMIAQPTSVAPPTIVDDADGFSDDFEWDNDFTSSPSRGESRTLLSKPTTDTGSATWPGQPDVPSYQR